jgi:tetratricopeptide (TPR) repeat protein
MPMSIGQMRSSANQIPVPWMRSSARMISEAAHSEFRIVEETQPYIVAAALYAGGKGDLSAADKVADHIIAFGGAADQAVLSPVNLTGLTGDAQSDDALADAFGASAQYIDGLIGILSALIDRADRMSALPSGADENVVWAVNLKGLIAATRGDDTKAIAFYKKVPQFAVARNNLGLLYLDEYKLHHDQLKLKMGIAEYQAAIWLDPKYALPHNNLGVVYEDEHKLDDAIAEYKIAIELDPKFCAATRQSRQCL